MFRDIEFFKTENLTLFENDLSFWFQRLRYCTNLIRRNFGLLLCIGICNQSLRGKQIHYELEI